MATKQAACRLKQQMMTEQEDEEEKVRWRVDAEVKLAMEEFKAAESQRSAGTQGMTHCPLGLLLDWSWELPTLPC